MEKETETEQTEQTASDMNEGDDMEAHAEDLTQYEYVCTHCEKGSHEPGKCACGMDYEKNPDFAGNTSSEEDSEN